MIGAGGAGLGGGVLPPAEARARPAFVLTPLADIMFQLLIFFMLSTSLAPYALLPLSAPAPAAPVSAPAPAAAGAGSVAVWHLGRAELRDGTRRIPMAALPGALAALAATGVGDLAVLVAADAQVQDLADIVEAAGQSGLVRVQLIGR